MTLVDVDIAAAQLLRLVEEAAAGEEIIIADAGKPLAKLVPLEQPEKRKRKLGLLAGRAVIPPDFDTPLPDDVLNAFEGRR